MAIEYGNITDMNEKNIPFLYPRPGDEATPRMRYQNVREILYQHSDLTVDQIDKALATVIAATPQEQPCRFTVDEAAALRYYWGEYSDKAPRAAVHNPYEETMYALVVEAENALKDGIDNEI